MTAEDREADVRRRLDAYAERQRLRAADIGRFATALAGARKGAEQGAAPAIEPRRERAAAHPRAQASGLPSVTIVIPVHNGADELEECLVALARQTTYPASVLLVDDASTDPRVERLLHAAARLDGVLALTNTSRIGFAASVDRARLACDGDVVVLSPQTAVGPRWLEQLVQAAYAGEPTETASPPGDDASGIYIRRAGIAAPVGHSEHRDGERPRLLFVIHEGGGGAVAVTQDLMAALAGEFECYCFSSDRVTLRLRRVDGHATQLLEEWSLDSPLRLADISRADYRDAFTAAIVRSAPDLVHIGHLFKHTFDAPSLAAENELPIVLSFHDHYFICPTIHLLDEQGRYCAGECTPGPGVCPTVRGGTLPVLKHAFVYQWREDVERALRHVDAFVTCSAYTRDIHRRFLTVTGDRPFELIEHGRDLAQRRLAVTPQPGGRVRILVPAHLDRHKGAELLAAMCELDRAGRLELHFIGDVPKSYRHLGVMHGPYERDQLSDRVREIEPSFIGVFSTTGESYSFAVTEAWAAGVPVIATDLGAQAQRVRHHGGGFVISHDDPAAALAQVLAVADDPVAYARESARASAADLPGVAEMAAEYARLYRDVLDRRRTLAALETIGRIR